MGNLAANQKKVVHLTRAVRLGGVLATERVIHQRWFCRRILGAGPQHGVCPQISSQQCLCLSTEFRLSRKARGTTAVAKRYDLERLWQVIQQFHLATKWKIILMMACRERERQGESVEGKSVRGK